MKDESRYWPPPNQGISERSNNQIVCHAPVHAPTNDPTGEDIQYHC